MAGEFLGGRTARRPDWAGRALAMAGGLLVAAAYPGPALLPPATGAWLVLPGVALLYLALARTRREREAFGCGWIAGAAHFALALHWMVHPFLVKADTHLWALPLAAVAVPAGFGLFWATAFAVARRMASRGPWLALAFALALSALEWVRGSALTGFPWAMPGQGWIHGETRSLYPAMGAYGAMFLTLLLPALAVSGRDGRRLAASLALTSAAAALVVVLCGFWADRATYPDAADGAARLRLVQPNIPQREKWARVYRLRNLSRLIALSESPGGGPPDVVIWPESALPTAPGRTGCSFAACRVWRRRSATRRSLPTRCVGRRPGPTGCCRLPTTAGSAPDPVRSSILPWLGSGRRNSGCPSFGSPTPALPPSLMRGGGSFAHCRSERPGFWTPICRRLAPRRRTIGGGASGCSAGCGDWAP